MVGPKVLAATAPAERAWRGGTCLVGWGGPGGAGLVGRTVPGGAERVRRGRMKRCTSG